LILLCFSIFLSYSYASQVALDSRITLAIKSIASFTLKAISVLIDYMFKRYTQRKPKSRKDLQAVFFDLDETLIKNNIPVRQLFPKVFYDFQDKIGYENKHAFFKVLQEEVKGLWERMFESDINPEQQLVICFIKALNNTRALDPTKVPRLAKKMVAHFFKLGSFNVELHNGAIETLEGLRKKGIIVGIITNGMETLQIGKIKRLQLDLHIDNLTISAEALAHKPDKAIFDLALARAGVDAEQAWFVGDHITNDVAGAVRAGLHSIYYNPRNLHVENSFIGVVERPDYTINHLTELLEYL